MISSFVKRQLIKGLRESSAKPLASAPSRTYTTKDNRYFSATYLVNPGLKRDQTVSVCSGEGIGNEIVDSVLQVWDCLKVPLTVRRIKYENLQRNIDNMELKANKNLLLGPITNKAAGEEHKGIDHQQILRELDVFASVLNPISIDGVKSNFTEIDMLIIQQAEKGLKDGEVDRSGAEYEKLAQYAFNNASMGNRAKLNAIHKSSEEVRNHEDFLSKMRILAREKEDIQYEETLLEVGAAKLTQNPEAFDLLVLPGGCGDTISDIAMDQVGGHQLVPSVHIGDKFSIFEQGGNQPDYAKVGKNSANPTGLLLASSMMLRQVDLPCYADIIERTVFNTYLEEEVRTPELGGNYSTSEFTQKVIQNLEFDFPRRHISDFQKPSKMEF